MSLSEVRNSEFLPHPNKVARFDCIEPTHPCFTSFQNLQPGSDLSFSLRCLDGRSWRFSAQHWNGFIQRVTIVSTIELVDELAFHLGRKVRLLADCELADMFGHGLFKSLTDHDGI